jgi:hypothetical protein
VCYESVDQLCKNISVDLFYFADPLQTVCVKERVSLRLWRICRFILFCRSIADYVREGKSFLAAVEKGHRSCKFVKM